MEGDEGEEIWGEVAPAQIVEKTSGEQDVAVEGVDPGGGGDTDEVARAEVEQGRGKALMKKREVGSSP
jgi:hypothetical protein